jgi:hypothetical protein
LDVERTQTESETMVEDLERRAIEAFKEDDLSNPLMFTRRQYALTLLMHINASNPYSLGLPDPSYVPQSI